MIKKSGSTVVELVVVVVVKLIYGLALLKHGGLGWPTNYLHYLWQHSHDVSAALTHIGLYSLLTRIATTYAPEWITDVISLLTIN